MRIFQNHGEDPTSVLNVKVPVDGFNQEKAPPGRVHDCETFANIRLQLYYLRVLAADQIDHTSTPCLASAQPQVSCPRAGPPPPSLIHMLELGFVGLLNNPRQIFAQLQK